MLAMCLLAPGTRTSGEARGVGHVDYHPILFIENAAHAQVLRGGGTGTWGWVGEGMRQRGALQGAAGFAVPLAVHRHVACKRSLQWTGSRAWAVGRI